VVGRVDKVEIVFFIAVEWESGGPVRVASGGGVNSILRFRFEKRDDGTKRCRKIKRRQRGHLNSMRRKYDTTQQRGDVSQRRCGIGEGKERRRCQLGWHESLLG
jgi:hypothetical protein